MDKNDRQIKYNIASARAKKVRDILAEADVTFGEALSLGSELFQVLSIMGETAPILSKALAYLTIRIQGSELDNTPMSEYGILNKRELLNKSRKASEDSSRIEGHDDNVQE